MKEPSRSGGQALERPGRRVKGMNVLPPRQLIHQAVQHELKAFIIQRNLRPGDALPAEGELAEHFGVSRNSVREAVKALEGLGIVEARAGAGLFVCDFSLDRLLDHLAFGMLVDAGALSDIVEVRLALETGMADAVIAGATDNQLLRLREILREWEVEAGEGGYPAELDRRLHETLHAKDGNELVSKLLDTFWRVFDDARANALVAEPDDPWKTYEIHVAIVDAVEHRDADELRSAFTVHNRRIQRRIDAAANR